MLDYRLQQYRLLPLLCTAFVFKWMGFAMDATMAGLQRGIAAGDFSALQEATLHLVYPQFTLSIHLVYPSYTLSVLARLQRAAGSYSTLSIPSVYT